MYLKKWLMSSGMPNRPSGGLRMLMSSSILSTLTKPVALGSISDHLAWNSASSSGSNSGSSSSCESEKPSRITAMVRLSITYVTSSVKEQKKA
jgi:hypothetical protein